MKIKFNSDYELSLNKTIEIPSMIIVVRAGFFCECLYKLYTGMRKLSCTKKKQKYNLWNQKFPYFTWLFINYNYIIDSF